MFGIFYLEKELKNTLLLFFKIKESRTKEKSEIIQIHNVDAIKNFSDLLKSEIKQYLNSIEKPYKLYFRKIENKLELNKIINELKIDLNNPIINFSNFDLTINSMINHKIMNTSPGKRNRTIHDIEKYKK